MPWGSWFRVSPQTLRWLGFLLSLAALGALAGILANADWRDVVALVATARVEWLGAALVLALAVEMVKTLRWQLLLGAQFSRLLELFALVCTTRLLNELTMVRAGEVWRIAAAARAHQRGLLLATTSVAAEKLLDAAALSGLSLVVLASVEAKFAWPLLVGAGALTILGAALLIRRAAGRRTWPRWWSAGPQSLWRPWTLVGATGLTAAVIALGLLINTLILRALDLPTSVATAVIMLLAGYAMGVVPAWPGRFGVFELGVAMPLIASGLTPPAAVAAAATLHLVALANLVLGGVLAVLLGWLGHSGSRAWVKRSTVSRS